jgi:hypothetical protein
MNEPVRWYVVTWDDGNGRKTAILDDGATASRWYSDRYRIDPGVQLVGIVTNPELVDLLAALA